MVGTITTPVGGERTEVIRWRDATLLLVGSGLGGAALGSLLGAIGGTPVAGSILSSTLLLLVLAMLGIAGARETLGLMRLRVWSPGRQVQAEWWGKYNTGAVSLLWGMQLGAGILSRFHTYGLYALVGLSLLTQNVALGAALMAGYGLARGVQPLLSLILFNRDTAVFYDRLAWLQLLIVRGSGTMMWVTGVLVLVAR